MTNQIEILKRDYFGGENIKKWGIVFCGGTEKGVFLREISGPKGLGPLVMNLYSKKIKNGLKR